MARVLQFPTGAVASILGSYNDRWLTEVELINANTFNTIPSYLHATSVSAEARERIVAILEADLPLNLGPDSERPF